MFHSVCCAPFLLLAFAPGGYSGQAEQSRAPESAPSDVKLVIRTHSGQAVFQIGETIELDLMFNSAARKKYLLVTGDTLDRATVTPLSGWDHAGGDFNPLCPVITFMSVLSSTVPLSRKPMTLNLTLSDSVRFRDPGRYQITVESQRVGTANPKRLLTLHSNRLPLTILPATPQWQEETLRNAVAVLDATASTLDLKPEQNTARWQALDTLRYLGTPAAARELARQLKPEDPTFHHGFLSALLESPARDAVLKEMEGLLVDRDFPVSENFLCAMSYVAVGSDRTDQRVSNLKTLESRFRDELRSALKNKQGQALAVSTATANSGR